MDRTNKLIAVLLALLGGMSANNLLAGNYDTATKQQTPSTPELAQLASELADTAARLAELRELQAEPVAGAQSGETQTTTVRWLGSPSSGSTQSAADRSVGPPVVNSVVHAAAIAPRPAARAYRETPIAVAMPTDSKVIRAQASEGLHFLAQVPAEQIPAEQRGLELEQLNPQPSAELTAPSDAAWGDPVVCGAGGGCCDTCCGGCDTCCGPSCCCPRCKPRRIIVVGTEAVFLSPEINGTPVFYQYDDFDEPETLLFGPSFGDASMDDFYVAPRLWIGVQGCRWGIIGRYYHLRAAEHDHDPFVPEGQFDDHSFDVNNILEAYYTDIELTRNFCLHGCKNQFTFGARYALIEHHEAIYGRSITDEGTTDQGLLEGYARRNRQAHGTAITMSLNGRKPLFCNSCAHWFYNVRSSILWGCTHNEVESETSAIASGGATVVAAGSIDTATAVVDDDLFIGEVQVGLEWDFALRCLPAKAFFRTAFEYQYWDASQGLAASGSFAGINGPLGDYQVTTGSSAPGLVVDFVGLTIGTGFTW